MEFSLFLNNLGLYNEILLLQKIIDSYKIMCSNNREDVEVYNRFYSSLKQYYKEYQKLLHPLSKEHLKNKLLLEWNLIAPKLLENPEWIEKTDIYCKLPIYALVQNIVKEELEFFEFYAFLIENKLYNPNISVGVSEEPFFSMLPKKNLNIFSSLNELVIKDKRTDFHILQNGSDFFEYCLYWLKTALSQDKKYWEQHLLWCLENNLSVLDSKRYQSIKKENSWDYIPNIYEIFNKENHLDAFVSFLLTEEGIQIQCKNSIYPSIEREKAIDFYCERLIEVGKENSLLKRLKSN